MTNSVGRMMGHSVLHGGPPFYGLSKAVIHFWSNENVREDRPVIEPNDISDLDLRQIVEQVNITRHPNETQVMFYYTTPLIIHFYHTTGQSYNGTPYLIQK